MLETNEIFTITCEGIDVPSGVNDQPFSDDETKRGAVNRAKAVFDEYTKQHGCSPDFSVGLEGGVQTVSNDLECFAWIAVYNGSQLGCSRTASFNLPPVIKNLVINEGLELGDADDKVFSTVNSKQKGGTVGKLTRGVIDRAQYYETAVVLAMIPFLWPSLYDADDA
jgi:inosine/xanthosine triphosphatase